MKFITSSNSWILSVSYELSLSLARCTIYSHLMILWKEWKRLDFLGGRYIAVCFEPRCFFPPSFLDFFVVQVSRYCLWVEISPYLHSGIVFFPLCLFMSWNISFFFGVSWVFRFSVKETLLGWRGSFVGKKRKVAWQVGLLCLFWVIWKARNTIAFKDCVLSIQRLKASFVYLLWLETKLWIKDGPSTLIDFIDWVCLR